MKFFILYIANVLLVRGVSAAEQDEVKRISVKEGESVTLDPGVTKNPNDLITWYFNDFQIPGGFSAICADDQCKHQISEFEDRLKVDHQTGSLTIMNTKITDAGFYHLEISSNGSSFSISSIRSFGVIVISVFGVETDGESVSVMEGDSVTLHTDVEKTQHNTIKWYFNGMGIAKISGDLNSIFTDDQYVEGFRDRLKLDHQTGSLTIMNITNTDEGEYKVQIIISRISEKIFSVFVTGVPGKETHKMMRKSVKEGESVTLDPGVTKNPNDVMKWYFNEILIAEITGDQSKICTDDQCDERFRDRLKLDHQTGSLTIMNTRITDEGEYKLEINSSSSSIRHRRNSNISINSFKSFSVAVIESGQSIAIICAGVGVLLLVSAAVTTGVIYCHRKNSTPPGQNASITNIQQDNPVDDSSQNKSETTAPLLTVPNESSSNPSEIANATST